MKKILAIFLALTMLLCFAACGTSGVISGENKDTDPNDPKVPDINGKDPTGQDLKEPELVWWQIKTNTGIPTFVAELKNPNKSTVDLQFSVTYYLNGEKLITRPELYVNALEGGASTMVFDTWEIPKAADKVEIKYDFLLGSMYDTIPVKIVKEEPFPDGLTVELSPEKAFSEIDFRAAFFLGDKLTSIDQHSFFKGEDLKYTINLLEKYDSYKLYVTGTAE